MRYFESFYRDFVNARSLSDIEAVCNLYNVKLVETTRDKSGCVVLYNNQKWFVSKEIIVSA